MEYIGIIVNNKKDTDFVHFKKLAKILHESGFAPIVTRDYRNVLPENYVSKATLDEMFRKASVVISLGGDGTLLNIADIAVKYDVAVLGVNLGNLGYLAQLDKTEIHKIPEILRSKYKFQRRMMLDVSVFRANNKIYEYSALNDAVVTRSAVLKPIYIDLYGESGIIAEYFCDGLIFSTPTGSSAYSLSVGGPVMDPTMDAILVSAISPHSLSAHSLVFNSDKILECKVKTVKSVNSLISVDGRHVFYLQPDDRIVIKKNNKPLKVIQLSDCDFYTVLKHKFSSRGKRNEK
jgi:NAD+ kinase